MERVLYAASSVIDSTKGVDLECSSSPAAVAFVQRSRYARQRPLG